MIEKISSENTSHFYSRKKRNILHRCVSVMCIYTHFAAYMYMDLGANEDADLPQEIKEKYTLTKTLGR